ncbi:GNAT family N-acetyltransferase [Pseudomonas quasicaspiana]|uniref:GNAT family N-acetyltransferase n=1 Tax=Pseudomonas quasicaspiana TaxID=2829821 RepID=UPI001E4B76EA|nr:GNAT family N-acetyltransferase [Pseudomonas quasicaspiana]MCD5979065.1 GNAT family N-acetyltransferase [Pseudomonas quasicaspiana]
MPCPDTRLLTPALCTARLLLRPLQLEDADALQASFAHWEVVRYLTHHVPWPYPEGETLRYLREDALPAMNAGEEWHWTLRLRSEPEQLIGAACLMDEAENNRGFWLAKPYQGQGLMSEACAALNRFWFLELGRPTMRAAKAALNVASCRLSHREGMRLIERHEELFVCGKAEEQIWEITREEWFARNAP